MKILFIDHDDSFSNNIISFFRARNFCVDVKSHNDPHLLHNEFPIHDYEAVIFSPGPGSPEQYQHSVKFYLNLPHTTAVLGVCLGHQIMLYASGGQITQISARPVHGRQLILNRKIVSRLLGKIRLVGSLVLYHSLGCRTKDPVFKLWHSLISQNGVCLMAEHSSKPHIGVQFHPESFASSVGVPFLNKFIRLFSL